MKRINRAQLRGKPLIPYFCVNARTTTHESGDNDNRIFCHGFIDCSTEELCDECYKCKANVRYAEPMEDEDE